MVHVITNLITADVINVLRNVMTHSILGIFALRARETIGLRRMNAWLGDFFSRDCVSEYPQLRILHYRSILAKLTSPHIRTH